MIDSNAHSTTNEPAPTQKPDQQKILAAQAELGYRLSLPWLIILAPMLAVPLAQVRPRQGRWLRLLPASYLSQLCLGGYFAEKLSDQRLYPRLELSFCYHKLYGIGTVFELGQPNSS